MVECAYRHEFYSRESRSRSSFTACCRFVPFRSRIGGRRLYQCHVGDGFGKRRLGCIVGPVFLLTVGRRRICRVECRTKPDKINGLKRGDRIEVEGQTRVAVEPRLVNAKAKLLERSRTEPPPMVIPFAELLFDPMRRPEFLARYGEYASVRR